MRAGSSSGRQLSLPESSSTTADKHLKHFDRPLAGDGGNATDALRHRLLTHDLEQARLARSLQVRAAAELRSTGRASPAPGSPPDHHDAHRVRVLLAEHGSHAWKFLRLGERHRDGHDGQIGLNALVDVPLDLSDLVRRQRLAGG